MLSVLFLVSSQLSAQTNDAEPPNLGFEPTEQAARGAEQLFEVSATDNVDIESVVLFYRYSADAEYQQIAMARQASSNTYSVVLPAHDIGADVEIIQYYIQASDLEGNRTLEGFAFDPLSRTLLDPSQLSQETSQSDEGLIADFNRLSTGKKILYGALGVLTVGALIAASDSGGTGVETGVPVTVLVEPLPIEN
jgi:hypothetical protein